MLFKLLQSVSSVFCSTVFVFHVSQPAYVPHALAFRRAYAIKVDNGSDHLQSRHTP